MNISPEDFKEKLLNNEHLPSGLVVEDIIYCDKALIDKIPREDLPLYLNFNFENEIKEIIKERINYDSTL